jgi:hypothetical protein
MRPYGGVSIHLRTSNGMETYVPGPTPAMTAQAFGDDIVSLFNLWTSLLSLL